MSSVTDEIEAILPSITLEQLTETVRDHLSRQRGRADARFLKNLLNGHSIHPEDWRPYVVFDSSTKCTKRRLLSTDKTFGLVLYCWNKDADGAISSCSGATHQFMKGTVAAFTSENSSTTRLWENDCFYADAQTAEIGVKNYNTKAVTLHLCV